MLRWIERWSDPDNASTATAKTFICDLGWLFSHKFISSLKLGKMLYNKTVSENNVRLPPICSEAVKHTVYNQLKEPVLSALFDIKWVGAKQGICKSVPH